MLNQSINTLMSNQTGKKFQIICTSCKGIGSIIKIEEEFCNKCQHKGKIYDYPTGRTICQDCNGNGYNTRSTTVICDKCKGAGNYLIDFNYY